MKSCLWSKTILSVYKYLERIAGAIDKLIDRNAMNSFYYFTGSVQDNSVMAVANRIIELSDRKIKLINLKLLTEKSLERCDKDFAQILILKYIDCEKSEDIAKRFNLSMRTYFRRLNQAEEQFYNILAFSGFNEKKLNCYLKTEKWILEVYNKYNIFTKERENLFNSDNILNQELLCV